MTGASGSRARLLILACLTATLCGCEAAVTTPVVTTAPSPASAPVQTTPAALGILPASTSVGIGHSANFTASGGVAPYTFSVSAGSLSVQTPSGGTIGSLGVFTAPFVPSTITITLQDVVGTAVQATVSITVGTSLSPNDTYFSQQTDLKQSTSAHIHAAEAWSLHTDCSAVPVAVLDTGIDQTHPDLAANIWTNPSEIAGNGVDDDGNSYIDDIHGWNFVANTNSPNDDHYHGTHIAGTIGAVSNNSAGIAGICWKAAIVPLKFLDSEGGGTTSDAIEAIHYAMSIGVKVINGSFGGGSYLQSFKDVLDLAATNGVIFVAAAGNDANDNDATPTYPANYSSASMIAVAAVSGTDTLASFSNYGATSVVIAAPGVSILSTTPAVQNTSMQADGLAPLYARLSGTSMAAPHVAGVATLYKAFDSSQTASSIKSRLLSGADVIGGLNTKVAGSKRLNARSTLY